jgi:predicted nuclease of predicted toxin-antitoxin system
VKVRFQADADLNEDIVTGVRRRVPEIDFQTAHAANLHGLQDEIVLALAAQEGRVVVSHDLSTMPTAFGNFIQNNTSAGLIIITQHTPLAVAIEELILIWVASEAEEYENVVMKIPL